MREELRFLEPHRARGGRRNAQRMDMNENPYGCSANVVREVRRARSEELTLYPEYDSLLEALAQSFSLKKDNFILTCGGDDAIRTIIEACVNKNGKVVLPVPTYSMLPIFLKAKGARISEILYNKGLSFPSTEVLSSIDESTELVALVNPGNPTGTLIQEGDLERILEKGVDVLLDETYWHFSGKSYAGLVEKFGNLFIVQSFSKVYGLAGMRVGFVISSRENIEELRKIAFPYPVSSLGAKAAEAALLDREFSASVVERTEREKRYLKKALKPFCEVRETHTNFLLAHFGDKSSWVLKELEKKGIIVRDMSGYLLLKGCLRISVGRRRENRVLISALKDVFEIME